MQLRFRLGAPVMLCGILASSLLANGGLNNTWGSLYPTSSSGDNAGCQVCHGSQTDTWNPYGWAIRLNIDGGANDANAIMMAEAADADGDPTGTSNLGEIDLDTQPGWTDGPNNTIFEQDGSFMTGQMPAPGIAGDLDPVVDCIGDVDNSGSVNVVDLLALIGAWGACPDPCPPCAADLDDDCEVAVTDLLALLGAWGSCP